MSTLPKKRKSKNTNKSDNSTTPTPTPTPTDTPTETPPSPTTETPPPTPDTIIVEATPTPATYSTTDTAMADTHYSNRQQQQEQQHQQQYYGGQHQESLTSKLYSAAPSSRQAVKFLTASTIGTILLVLSGLTLTGTVISLIVTTPLLVLFSPILVPAAITVLLIGSGFVFSGGCGVAALSALSWIYQYLTGKHPPGADQLDHARMRIANAARDVKDRARDVTGTTGHYGGQTTTYHTTS